MRKFTMIDESFICFNCGKEIKPLGYSARNHCPHCLHSLHLDINPGDRASTCKGELVPIGIEKYRDTYKIVFKCKKCGEVRNNVAAEDDDFNKIIELSVKKF